MLSKAVADAARVFAGEVKASEVYLEYEKQLQKVKEDEGLYAKVNEFRKKNYELQLLEPAEDMLERVENFEQEYEAVIAIPLVSDFLRAELAFCRMMQNVNLCIAQELNFE